MVKLKGVEQKLIAQIQKDETKKNKIKNQIDSAIAKELASNKKTPKTTSATKPKTIKTATGDKKPKEVEKVTPVFAEPKELALNQGFETNKGRLPWPVQVVQLQRNLVKMHIQLFQMFLQITMELTSALLRDLKLEQFLKVKCQVFCLFQVQVRL